MLWTREAAVCAMMLSCQSVTGDEVAAGFGGWAAGILSPEVRRLNAERTVIMRELSALPAPAGADTGERLGWHTRILAREDEPVWVRVDLGRRVELDQIALVPARGAAFGEGGAGYGFPRRFRVEAADAESFEQATLLADFTARDVENPRELPLVIEAGGHAGRFIRITVTRAWARREHWIVALGELMVISGGRNVAAGAPVTALLSLNSRPAWDAANLTDSQSALGPPVSPDLSPTNGYLARHEMMPHVTKWVAVDLGEVTALDEIRLLPARPQDFADSPGLGFPVRFRVEAALDEEFAQPTTLLNATQEPFSNPGENTVIVQARGVRGRHVRVTATELHSRGTVSTFSLGELQVWAGDRNAALGGRVTALDTFDDPRFPRWAPAYLVDGFNSTHRLLTDAEWIAGLARRAELTRRLGLLDQKRAALQDAALALAAKAGAAGVGGLVLLGAALLGLARRAKRVEVEALRRRIASDLHDEIGSQLGSIALAAQLAARNTGGTPAMREPLAEIERMAREANEAMRDIVWLLKPGGANSQELAARVREASATHLREPNCEFVSDGGGAAPLNIEFTREVYLFCREAFANISKHARARSVKIAFHTQGALAITIQDDGVGFDPGGGFAGHGLDNMRQRAARIGGELEIRSAPGAGTTISLRAPLR